MSLAERLAELEPAERAKVLGDLSRDELLAIKYDWRGVWAREKQLPPPGRWRQWMLKTGRGFGKTRSVAEWVREGVEKDGLSRIGVIHRTARDTRDVVVEGESGILSICPPWNRPLYEPSKARVVWPNGATLFMYGADEPDLLRGPQFQRNWYEELATWRYPEAYDNASFGLRLPGDPLGPRAAITTTPKNVLVLRKAMAKKGTRIVDGSLYENVANLAPEFVQEILDTYEGTRLGRAEIHGELLLDVPGALWTIERIERTRVPPIRLAEDLDPTKIAWRRMAVAVDPAVTSAEGSDETGIVIGGVLPKPCPVCGRGDLDHFGVVADYSGIYTPGEWGSRVVSAYERWRADRVVAEVNNGGDLVERNLRLTPGGASIPYTAVHASRGKVARAEPQSALYEKDRVHHFGSFAKLEDQQTTYVPGTADSPDRVDALVWLLTNLSGGRTMRAL